MQSNRPRRRFAEPTRHKIRDGEFRSPYRRSVRAQGDSGARHFLMIRLDPAMACTQEPYTGDEAMEMELDPREASLVEIFRRLPPDTAAELSALAERLAALSPQRKLDWSDSWSDEDLRDFRAASLRRLDAEESEESH